MGTKSTEEGLLTNSRTRCDQNLEICPYATGSINESPPDEQSSLDLTAVGKDELPVVSSDDAASESDKIVDDDTSFEGNDFENDEALSKA